MRYSLCNCEFRLTVAIRVCEASDMRSTQEAATTAIRLHLAARNKTQSWLAEKLKRSVFWIGRRMSGDVLFDSNTLDEIARVFGVTVAELLSAADAVKVPSAVEEAVAS